MILVFITWNKQETEQLIIKVYEFRKILTSILIGSIWSDDNLDSKYLTFHRVSQFLQVSFVNNW